MNLRTIILALTTTIVLCKFTNASIIAYTNITNVHSVQKRALVFTNGGTYKMLAGFALPISIGEGRTIGFACNVQFQYGLPQNLDGLSNLFTGVTYARRRREASQVQDSTRKTAYKILESLMSRQGLNGEECLLRMICEEAESPLYTNSLLSEVMHTILTPNSSPNVIEPMEGKYSDAQLAGSLGADCRTLYHGCASASRLLDLITALNII